MRIFYLLILVIIFCISAYAQTQSLHVEAGWNLLSLPVHATDSIKSSLFPTATSAAFVFQNGYQAKDTLENGLGFWLKFDSAETIFISGDTIFVDTIDVHLGWNMIGSISSPVGVGTIKSEPSGIIASPYYSYVPGVGYQQTDSIQPGIGYWVKVNQNGIIILNPNVKFECGTSQVFYSGKTYNTVQVGAQCWLKENLDVGQQIVGSQLPDNNSTIEKYCYNDDSMNCVAYGGIYLWGEAMQYTTHIGAQGICPSGWHMPTYGDFYTLTAAVNYDGNALKAIGQGTGAGAGTNTSGFSALLAGGRSNGVFSNLGLRYSLWSSTRFEDIYAWTLRLNSGDNSISVFEEPSWGGFSVRCILGAEVNTPPERPRNPSPTDSTVGLTTDVTISWTSGDIDGDPVTYDIYFATDNPPTTKVSTNQTVTSLSRSSLVYNTTYYWMVVARDNFNDSIISPVWRFTIGGWNIPCPGIPTVSYAGKTYNTVQVGARCWLKENLDVGTKVNVNQTNNGIIEKYCYNNDTNNCNVYGGLYEWNEAMQYITTEGARGICPTGWHVPTYIEYSSLGIAVNNHGNELKAIGQGTDAGAGTNTSGFSALLAGSFSILYNFVGLGSSTRLWSSTEFSTTNAYYRYLNYNTNGFYVTNDSKNSGLSIRCTKD
jgi:uncharacterized protein (TIGR02145 family)